MEPRSDNEGDRRSWPRLKGKRGGVTYRLRNRAGRGAEARLAAERGTLMRQDREERDQEALMRELDRNWECGFTPWAEMRRWRRRFWFAVALAVVLAIELLWQLAK
jgi:hypothetical protein